MGSAHSKNDTHGNGNVALQERSDDILVPKMNHQLSTKAKGREKDQVEVLKILVKEITNDLIIEKEKNMKLEEEKKQLQDSLKEATTAKKDATSLETDDDDDTSLQTNDDDVASNHRRMARYRSRWILPPILASRSLNPTLRRSLDEAEEMSLKAMEPPSDEECHAEYFKKYFGINIDDTDNDDDDSDDNDDTFVQCEINDNGTNDNDDTDDDDDDEEET